MGITVVTPPTSDPVSLDEAKDHLRVTSDLEDGRIAGCILAARVNAERITRCTFRTQTIDCTYDSPYGCWPEIRRSNGHATYYGNYCQQRLELPVTPVQSVESISYVDGDGSEQTLGDDQWVAVLDRTVAYIEPAYGVTWPGVRAQSQAITVEVVAGWPDDQFPEDLRQALLLLTAHFYENRAAVTTGGRAEIPTEVPLALEAILSGYAVKRVLS